MSNNYTPKNIPPEAWKRVTSIIKDYDRLKNRLNKNNCTIAQKKLLKIQTAAVEDALSKTDDEHRELIRAKYWQQKTYRDINMPLSESTMKRYVREIVVAVGENLGEF